MAVPTRRQSRTRGKKRRSHDALTLASPVTCPECGEPRMPHRACPACGSYKGLEVIQGAQE
jgi:large subunit ribosomal protein L32